MAWLVPKTDWQIQPPDANGNYNGDWFNWQDYERIRSNIKFLRDFASALYAAFPYIFMPTIDEMVAEWNDLTGWTVGATITDDMRYAALYNSDVNIVNAFERNLDTIVEITDGMVEIEPTKTWHNLGYTPTYEDWNRIEDSCIKILEWLVYYDSIRPIGIAFDIEANIAGEFD